MSEADGADDPASAIATDDVEAPRPIERLGSIANRVQDVEQTSLILAAIRKPMNAQYAQMVLRGEYPNPLLINIYNLGSFEKFGPIEGVEMA